MSLSSNGARAFVLLLALGSTLQARLQALGASFGSLIVDGAVVEVQMIAYAPAGSPAEQH
jgi:hypothetical protein